MPSALNDIGIRVAERRAAIYGVSSIWMYLTRCIALPSVNVANATTQQIEYVDPLGNWLRCKLGVFFNIERDSIAHENLY